MRSSMKSYAAGCHWKEDFVSYDARYAKQNKKHNLHWTNWYTDRQSEYLCHTNGFIVLANITNWTIWKINNKRTQRSKYLWLTVYEERGIGRLWQLERFKCRFSKNPIWYDTEFFSNQIQHKTFLLALCVFVLGSISESNENFTHQKNNNKIPYFCDMNNIRISVYKSILQRYAYAYIEYSVRWEVCHQNLKWTTAKLPW